MQQNNVIPLWDEETNMADEPRKVEGEELSSEELKDKAAAIGLVPVQAFVRRPRSAAAQRQARYRERQKAKELAEKQAKEAPQQVAATPSATPAAPSVGPATAPAGASAAVPERTPAVDWEKRAGELQARIDAFNALPWILRIWRRV